MPKFHYLQQHAKEGFHTKEHLYTLLNHLKGERSNDEVEDTVRKVYALMRHKAELTPELKLKVCHLLAPVMPVWFGDEEDGKQ